MWSKPEGGRSSGTIPSWDGAAKGWRRYCKEVAWYTSGTKRPERRYLATRLIPQLTGSARLLAMSWNQGEFDQEKGVLVFLQKLAKSPLVRKTIPNAAAIMTQYFGFKRFKGEPISSFLVRELLGFEEFSEALLTLKEERAGIDPARRDFGLPDLSDPTSGKGDGYGKGQQWQWRQHEPWWEDQDAAYDEAEAEVGEEDTVPMQDGKYDEVPQRSIASSSPPPQEEPLMAPAEHSEIDSFILDVLEAGGC